MKNEILINEPELVETKSSKKVKYSIAIIASTLVLATVATLLIGHYKFNWFKSDDYKIDANINRQLYQANYFSEKKTITTKFSFTTGDNQNQEYIVDSNFVVFLTDKKDNLNTAILVLLSSTLTKEGEVHDLAHLNMFDENELKDLEANPDGAKYPFAVFKFTDDGKVEGIKLPSTIEEYNADTLVEIIKSIIPKLSRNKKEDMSNGLVIDTKKENNKNIIVQTQAPKQYDEFEGSRHSKIVRTEIEDDQIKTIKSDSNIYFQSQPKDDEIIFGPKDFSYNTKSEITSNEVKYEEKENVDLAKKLVDKFTLVDSEELLQAFRDKKLAKVEEEETKQETEPLRNLGFAISATKTFKLASFNIAGQTVSVKYVVSISNNKASNKIVLTSGKGTFEFGNKGCSGTVKDSKHYSEYIFKFVVPDFPAVTLGCYATGDISWELGFSSGSGSSTKYYAKISGRLALGAEVKAGWDAIASLSAFAEGTVAKASGQVTISKGSVTKGSGFSMKMGELEVGIRGCALGVYKKELWKKTLIKGWKYA